MIMKKMWLVALLTIVAVVGLACVGQPDEVASLDVPVEPAEVVNVVAGSPLPTPAQPADDNAGAPLLLWEGSALFAEDPAECHRLRLTQDYQAFLGLCDGQE
ncbi:MAG: hypothetical protein R3264_17205, partial [Anaerolineae bacterium]|nr:hypothetical protein [Anaerolineae bacterium]